MTDWKGLRRSLLGDRSRSVVPPRVKLPVLPLAMLKFSRKAEEPDACHYELARIIETDSALTTELLRYVNSAAIGLRHRVSSAQQAISILGISLVKLHLASVAIRRSMRKRESKLINIPNFWNANLERALFAREVAKLIGGDRDLAFAAGLLQDFLLPPLTNDLFPNYFRFTKEHVDQPIGLTQFERQTLGWDHAEAAAQIMAG